MDRLTSLKSGYTQLESGLNAMEDSSFLTTGFCLRRILIEETQIFGKKAQYGSIHPGWHQFQ